MGWVGLAGSGNETLSEFEGFGSGGGMKALGTERLSEGLTEVISLEFAGDNLRSSSAAFKDIQGEFMEGGGDLERLLGDRALINDHFCEALVDFGRRSPVEHKNQ